MDEDCLFISESEFEFEFESRLGSSRLTMGVGVVCMALLGRWGL